MGGCISIINLVYHTVFLEPLLGDEAPVAHDADAREVETLLAVAYQLPDVPSLLRDERLSTTEVHLLHTCATIIGRGKGY